jgi:hypothetical protein
MLLLEQKRHLPDLVIPAKAGTQLSQLRFPPDHQPRQKLGPGLRRGDDFDRFEYSPLPRNDAAHCLLRATSVHIPNKAWPGSQL